MPEIKTTYRSYLLRLWCEDEIGAGWRVMLESVAEPGRQRYFKDIESFSAYLMRLKDDEPPNIKGGETH